MSDMVSFPLADIEATAKRRPEGYMLDVVASGNIAGDRIWFNWEDYKRLKDRYDPTWRKATRTIRLGNVEKCSTCA